MACFVVGASALEFWRTPALSGDSYTRWHESGAQPFEAPTVDEVEVAFRGPLIGLSAPLHIVVGESRYLRRKGLVSCHLATNLLPYASFVQVARDVFVASPEYCFVQEAMRRSRLGLVVLGSEFCSHYMHDYRDGELCGREPLTSIEKIAAFIDAAQGLRGVRQARIAVRYVVENSASPRETDTALRLSLPQRYGGYGLEKPLLNYSVRSATSPTGYRICDLCWPSSGFAIEYESNEYHLGVEKFNRDSARRTELSELGFDTLTVTNEQVRNLSEFERVARVAARKTGARSRADRFDATAQRFALHEAMLDMVNRWSNDAW